MSVVAHRRSAVVIGVAFCIVFLASGPAALPESFERMVIFGDSLSDPGNHYVAFGMTSRAPFAPLPDFPYDIGGHHFSNGATWAEQLSHALGRSEEHTSELQSQSNLVCRLLLEKKKKKKEYTATE